jgi:hypothetical protein
VNEDYKGWDQATFDRKMQESQTELVELRMQLQTLLVKFGLRALRTYQAARNLPLKSNEIENLVKYEIDNVASDLLEKTVLFSIINKVKLEWENQQTASNPR